MQPKFLLIAGGAALGLATPAAAQMDHSNMPGMKMPPPKAPAVKKPAAKKPSATKPAVHRPQMLLRMRHSSGRVDLVRGPIGRDGRRRSGAGLKVGADHRRARG